MYQPMPERGGGGGGALIRRRVGHLQNRNKAQQAKHAQRSQHVEPDSSLLVGVEHNPQLQEAIRSESTSRYSEIDFCNYYTGLETQLPLGDRVAQRAPPPPPFTQTHAHLQ